MENDVIEEISKGIQWYFENSVKASIDVLMEFQDKMTAYSFWMAEITADQKKDYNLKYFSRKIEVAKSKQGFIKNQKSPVNKAEIDAVIENEDILKAEVEAESYTYKCDLLLKQTNKLLDAIRQRISFLKDEKRHSTTQV